MPIIMLYISSWFPWTHAITKKAFGKAEKGHIGDEKKKQTKKQYGNLGRDIGWTLTVIKKKKKKDFCWVV